MSEPLDPDPEATLGVAPAGAAAVLDGVSFRYPDGPDDDTSWALHGVDATIAAGRVTAVVGPTGAGKSTLVDVLGGLIPATAGKVAVLPGPRAVVFQEAFLFGGTVRDNITLTSYGEPAEPASPAPTELGDSLRSPTRRTSRRAPSTAPPASSTADDNAAVEDAAVWEALRQACAERFVGELPDGLDTLVGERGVTLSGGQRQRIALARALFRRPRLLLLDDTTSALDPATELAVLDNLRAAADDTSRAPMSVVIVASRPSTMALADDVLFVDDGRVAGHGTHAALYDAVPAYRELVEAFEAERQHSGDRQGGAA